MKVRELCNLKFEDIDYLVLMGKVKGKGCKIRKKFFSPKLHRDLLEFYRARIV